MHQRIRARRDDLGRDDGRSAATADAGRVSVRVGQLEHMLLELQAIVRDPRIDELITVARSTRLIVELAESDDRPASDLMPCALAAMQHMRESLLATAAALGLPLRAFAASTRQLNLIDTDRTPQ